MSARPEPREAPDRAEGEVLAELGRRVRSLREGRGWPRRELALRSGVSMRYLAQLESGEGNISVLLLSRVARALGVALFDLVAPEAPTPDEGRMLAAWRTAQPQARRKALSVLQDAVGRAQRVALVGLRGAGKSTLGRLASARLGIPFIELNREVERSAGMSVGEIISLTGPDSFRELEAAALEDVIARHERVLLEVAGGIVSSTETYERLLARFHVIWVRAEPEDHMARVRAQGDMRPMAGVPLAMAHLRGILASRESAYRRAEAELFTSGSTPDESAARLEALIRESGFIAAPEVRPLAAVRGGAAGA